MTYISVQLLVVVTMLMMIAILLGVVVRHLGDLKAYTMTQISMAQQQVELLRQIAKNQMEE